MYTIKGLEVLTDMPFVVFVKDEELKYVWCNKFCLHIAGLGSLDEVIGKTDYDLVWSEYAENYRRDDKEVLETGKTKNIQEHVNTPGGGLATCNTCKFPVTLDGKKCVMGVAVILDQ